MSKHIFKEHKSSYGCLTCIKCKQVFYDSIIIQYGRKYVGIPYVQSTNVFLMNEITHEPTGIIVKCKYSDEEFYVKQILT